MGSEHYCLRWNNHQSNLLGVFSQLLRDESLVDVTLACSEGHSIRAHKVVLSACSSYFQTLFIDHPSRHPIVILKDVRFSELRTLIEFMYKGEVNVEYCQLSALLKTAESLKVKGLAEMTRDCKTENEQNEPTELVTRKQQPHQLLMPVQPPVATIVRHEEEAQEQVGSSPVMCKESPDSEKETASISNENVRSESPMMCGDEEVPNDMTIHNNTAVTSSHLPPPSCGRLSPQIKTESLPGTSLLPPVQQVPLSLKKEVDWGGGSDDKNTKDPPEFSRSQDQELDACVKREGSPRLYPCMYCGQSFPHQSKLTRHILSHSLETLKYREMHQQHAALGIPPEAGPPYIESSPYASRVPMMAHEPPDPTDQPPTQMDLDMGDSAAMAAVSGGSNSGVVLCKFCGKSFPDVSSLISHLPVHTGDRPFKCEFCGKAFKLRHHMKDHCRVHTGERPFRCSLCGKTFSRSTILKAHEKTHYPKYETCFNTSPIDKPSSTQSSRSSTPFTIPFPSFTSSLLEMSLLHSGLLNEELYRCSSCMAAFPSVWLLEQHNALQHIGTLSSFDKPFICEQCGQSYRYRSAYVKHREQNHRARLPADKLFSCDVCGMQFRYLKSFKKHRLNHALEKLHGKTSEASKVSVKSEAEEETTQEGKCDNSSEVSSSNEVMSSQDMVVVKTEVEEDREDRDNNSTNEGQMSDADVEKTDSEQDNTVDSIGPLTPSSTNYNTDPAKTDQDSPIMNFLRGDNAARQRERKFACPFCGKCVRSKENLKLHVRKHTGERPFVCLFCGRAFGGKSDLTRHLRIHTGERPYHCDMCGKCFARADYLSKHLTTHINTPR